jgi:hypothetical protein
MLNKLSGNSRSINEYARPDMLEHAIATPTPLPAATPPPPPSPPPGSPRPRAFGASGLAPHQLCFAPHHGCGICYEQIGPAEHAAPMFCCHYLNVVHHRCLAKWMLQKRLENAPSQCPFCRRGLLTPEQFDALFALVPCEHAPDAGHAADPVLSMLPAPARMHAAELRLVRLTLLSWVTMLVNFIVAGLLFALCLRAMEAMSRLQH